MSTTGQSHIITSASESSSGPTPLPHSLQLPLRHLHLHLRDGVDIARHAQPQLPTRPPVQRVHALLPELHALAFRLLGFSSLGLDQDQEGQGDAGPEWRGKYCALWRLSLRARLRRVSCLTVRSLSRMASMVFCLWRMASVLSRCSLRRWSSSSSRLCSLRPAWGGEYSVCRVRGRWSRTRASCRGSCCRCA